MVSSNSILELVRAIRRGDKGKFARILDEKPNLNVQDTLGWTPLFYAVASGDALMTSELVKRGACTNVKDNSGWTPLAHARLDGKREICNLLAIRETAN
jgi:uncharacterized protein